MFRVDVNSTMFRCTHYSRAIEGIAFVLALPTGLDFKIYFVRLDLRRGHEGDSTAEDRGSFDTCSTDVNGDSCVGVVSWRVWKSIGS